MAIVGMFVVTIIFMVVCIAVVAGPVPSSQTALVTVEATAIKSSTSSDDFDDFSNEIKKIISMSNCNKKRKQ